MNQKTKNKTWLYISICVFVLSLGAGILIGAAITTPSISIESSAWDNVDMTEEQYTENFTQQLITDASENSDSDASDANSEIDINNILIGYNRCKNDDKVGWIYYPSICDYPVLYSGDTYYLNHTVDKEYSANGAIFCDAATESFFDGYTLIHGHHLRSDKMFTKLTQLKNAETFRANRYFYIYDGCNVIRYRVVAVTLINGAKELIPGSFNNETDKLDYLRSLTSRSMYSCSYTDEELLNAVVLHTCDYTFNNAHLLVMGVQEVEVEQP